MIDTKFSCNDCFIIIITSYKCKIMLIISITTAKIAFMRWNPIDVYFLRPKSSQEASRICDHCSRGLSSTDCVIYRRGLLRVHHYNNQSSQEVIVFIVVSLECCHVLDLLFCLIVLLVLRLSQLEQYGNTAIIFKIFQKVNSVWIISSTWSPF